MSDDPTWDSKTYWNFVWGLLTALSIERAEREALAEALDRAGGLPRELYQTLRLEKVQAAREQVQRIVGESDNPFLALLREFEGPVQ